MILVLLILLLKMDRVYITIKLINIITAKDMFEAVKKEYLNWQEQDKKKWKKIRKP